MATCAIPSPRWHLLEEPHGPIEALIVCLCDPAGHGDAGIFAARWRDVVPRCAFAVFEQDHGGRQIAFAPVQTMVGRQAQDLGLALSQIILIGTGRSGQHALDLALCNALPDVHVLAVDLPPDGVVVGLPPARGAFRFVQHRRADDPLGEIFDSSIHILREACLDIRTMLMPDEPAATERAIGTFLVELVARASRYQPTPRRDPATPLARQDRA